MTTPFQPIKISGGRYEYQATISECRKQLEAQVARRWTAAQIAHAKSRAAGLSGETSVTA